MNRNLSIVFATLLILSQLTQALLSPPERNLAGSDDLSAMMDSADNGCLISHDRKLDHESPGTGQPRQSSEEEIGKRAQFDD